MIQPIQRTEPKPLDMSDAEFERICQRAAREAVVRTRIMFQPSRSAMVTLVPIPPCPLWLFVRIQIRQQVRHGLMARIELAFA